RRIDGVAALPQDLATDLGCDLLLRHHHAVLGCDAMDTIGRRRDGSVLCRGRQKPGERNDEGCEYGPVPGNRLHQNSAVAEGQSVTPMLYGSAAKCQSATA